MTIMVLVIIPSVAMADDHGEAKRRGLFLFQKCDKSLIGNSGYDSFGCPNIGMGLWLSKGKGHDDDDDDDDDDDYDDHHNYHNYHGYQGYQGHHGHDDHHDHHDHHDYHGHRGHDDHDDNDDD